MRTGEVLAERFELEKRAGSGGMGEVYRAADRETGGRVAVKVLLNQGQDDEARFFREARILAELGHPHIVQYVSDGVTDAGDPWLAMEWLDGEPLSTRLSRGPLDSAESIVLATALAEALGFAHARGIIHRDFKPSNVILVDGDAGRAKLLDFGIARAGTSTRMTRTGMLLGTPGYMAPEQASGEGNLSARADVFSLGCVLYECLTGEPVFSGLHLMAILAKILLQAPLRLKDKLPLAPEALDDLLSRMLAKHPDERPANGHEVAAALRALGELPAQMRQTAAPVNRAAVLTDSEQRAVAVILIGAPGDVEVRGEPPAMKSPGNTVLRFEAERHGGHFEPMLDQSVAVMMTNTSMATDLAAQAARRALALRAHSAGRPIALTMGRGDVTTGRVPMGHAIDHAAKLIGGAQPGAPILLDDVVAGLLDARFDAREVESGFVLVGERELSEGTRTLLGKATPCVGRERELIHLEELFFDDCIDQSAAQVMLVKAPAGAGKSRLAHEFLRLVRGRDKPVVVWSGRGDSLRTGSAFSVLGQAVRGACGVREGEPLDVRREKVRACVSERIQEKDRQRVTEFLGEIIGTCFPVDDSLPLSAARQDAQLMNDQMRAAFVDFLGAECTKNPVLLLLEDLHWGDQPTVQFIDSALRDLKEQPFMVLALARPEVSEVFPRLWAERRFQQISLRPLNQKAIERLVRHVLGEKANAATVDRLAELSEGNAFYLEELIRWSAEGKTAQLPETVVAMVQSRLGSLDDGLRRLLRAASIFGEVFWSGAVSSLLGGAEHTTRTRNVLTQLAERELITKRNESRFPGEEEYAFHHALLREGAYSMLTEDDKTLGHRLAGAWLEKAGEPDPAMLAEHFERGGEHARAAELYAHAIEEALEANDLAGVLTRAERAIACGASGSLLGTVRARQADAHMWRGDFALMVRFRQEAMALLPAGSPLWFCTASDLALIIMLNRDTEQFERIAGELRRHAAALQETSDVAIAAVADATYKLLQAGAREAAEPLIEQLRTIEQTSSRPLAAGHIQLAVSGFLAMDGDLVAAAAAMEAAMRSLERVGDMRRVAMYRGDAVLLYLALGALEAAEEHLQAFIDGTRRLGLLQLVRWTEFVQMLIALRRGALDKASALANALLPLLGPPDQILQSAVRYVLAEALRRTGDLDAAEREAAQGAALSTAVATYRCMNLTALAAVHLARGLPGEAREEIEEAARLLEPPRLGIVLLEGVTRLVFAEVLYACGALEEAREAIAALRDFHLKRAAKMADPEVRRRYLEDIPEHARALELAAAWLPA